MTERRGARLILLVGLAVAGAVIWFGVLKPAQAWKDAQFAALAAAQGQSASLMTRLNTLQNEAAALSAAATFDGVWAAQNAGEATARVQATLSDLARQNNITLRAITPIPNAAIPLKQALAFRIEAEASLDQLEGFLRAAEYHSPVLVFENGLLRRLSKPGPANIQPQVFVQFDVMAAYELAEGQ